MLNPATGELIPQSFQDWHKLLMESASKIALLVEAFKVLHPGAPVEDSVPGGRLAGMVKQSSNDYGYILLKIWLTSASSIAGSHLNYINGCLRSKPVAIGADKYVGGKYGQFVQR